MNDATKSSKLVPVGIVMTLVGLSSGTVWRFAEQMSPGPLQALVYLSTDVLRLSTLAGITCLIIGSLRNRRWKKEAASK